MTRFARLLAPLGIALLVTAGTAGAQIAETPDPRNEDFPQQRAERSGEVFWNVPVSEFYAGIHMADLSSDVLQTGLDPSAFVFGPVPKDAGRSYICAYMNTSNGGYWGFWRYGVQGPVSEITPRALETDHGEALKQTFLAGQALSRAWLESGCHDMDLEVAVATGFSRNPTHLQVILGLARGIVTLKLRPEGGDDASAMLFTCEPIRLPTGFDCRLPLSKVPSASAVLSASVRFAGKDYPQPDIRILLPTLSATGQ